MPTLEDVAKQPREQRLGRMRRTADDFAAAVVICHLRDTEELFLARLEMIAVMDEPVFGVADTVRAC